MTNKKNMISHVDVKPLQISLWVFTGIIMIPVSISLILNGTLISFFIFIISMLFNIAIQYVNTQYWNIWYEDEELFFENIYKTYVKDIECFRKVEKKGFWGNYYILYLDDGNGFSFRIQQTKDFSTLFIKDNQLYAKEITKKVKDYIRLKRGNNWLY
jgi:hypothetical protein